MVRRLARARCYLGFDILMSDHGTNLSPARRHALDILLDVERRDAFARDLLNASTSVSNLDDRDAGFVRLLVLGVTATSGCLDDFLQQCSNPKTHFNPRVRCALRIAVFELLYLDAPANVAVSQGVELARSQSRGAAGLANAVLRRAADNRSSFLQAEGVDPIHARIVSLARKSGVPVWLARSIEESLGQDAALEVFVSELSPAPIAFHLNPLSGSRTRSAREGDCPIPGCFEPTDSAAYIRSGALGAYKAVASDPSAQLIATAATRPGTCLEIGSGRGTKTFIMACQAHRAGLIRDHVAVDLYQDKCRMNATRLIDAGLPPVRFAHGDARNLDSVLCDIDSEASTRVTFDTVLLDAPCSGTGTMRRHPEIPWRLTKKDIVDELPTLQFELLCAAASRVAAAGELYYATCSIMDAENMAVVQRFLSSPLGSGFKLAPIRGSAIFDFAAFAQVPASISDSENAYGCYASHPAPGKPDGHFCARLVRA